MGIIPIGELKWGYTMEVRMGKYKYNIKVNKANKQYGYIDGMINDIYWFALVHSEVVEDGIDPVTLEKSFGRITRLCLYKDSTSFEGNPFLPSMTVRRQIYVNYQNEWSVLNSGYVDMARDLVQYLDRRYSLRIIS